jgi:LysR family nitrogen assimilation transcriptional regulator
VDAACSRHGLKPRIVAEIDSLPSLRAAAECGFAATILPRSATSADTGSLLVTDIVGPTIERTIVLCRPSAPGISEPVQAIENVMIDTIEVLVASGKWQGVTRI